MIAWQSKWLINKNHKCQTSYFEGGGGGEIEDILPST